MPRKIDAKTVRRLKPLVEQGLSEREIQKTLGISRTTLQPYINRLKAELSPSHGEGHAVPADADPAAAPSAPQTPPVALVIDPEFQSLIPPLTAEEQAQLETNLRAEGCRDPLVVWPQNDGPPILLDGHTRYAICQQYGIPFQMAEAQGISTREGAQLWIVRNQLGRRNLTDFQRIELAERLRPLLAARAKANQQLAGGAVPQKVVEPVETRQAIAKIAGVSRETVRKAEVIMAEADDPTKDALRRDERKIHGVYQNLRGPRTASKRKALAEASATPPGAPTAMEPGRRIPMAERLIELAGAILEALASWRQQYPQDSAVGAFPLMEKHLRELQEYFRQKQHEMAERPAAVEVATVPQVTELAGIHQGSPSLRGEPRQGDSAVL